MEAIKNGTKISSPICFPSFLIISAFTQYNAQQAETVNTPILPASKYCIIPNAPITLQRRHKPGRLYRRTEGRVRLDRPRSGARLRCAVPPVRHAPDGPSDLRSRALPGPAIQEH